MAIQESHLATQLLVHAKRLNGSPEATLQLFDLFKPPTHQRMPLSGDFGLDGGGKLGGGQYLLGGGQLLALVRQLRARIFTLWKALLLGRRVLFYAPPPVGHLCERALSAHQLQAGWAACKGPGRLAPWGAVSKSKLFLLQHEQFCCPGEGVSVTTSLCFALLWFALL